LASPLLLPPAGEEQEEHRREDGAEDDRARVPDDAQEPGAQQGGVHRATSSRGVRNRVARQREEGLLEAGAADLDVTRLLLRGEQRPQRGVGVAAPPG